MSSAHEIRAYEYVNQPYDRVREVLLLDAIGVFQRATAAARADALVSTVRANVGPIELGADVVVSVTAIGEDGSSPHGPRTRLRLAWKAAERPELFPTMEATLDVYPLGPGETQVDFQGEYAPPLGLVGAAFDAVVGRHVAKAAVHRFVQDVAERLRVDAAPRD